MIWKYLWLAAWLLATGLNLFSLLGTYKPRWEWATKPLLIPLLYLFVGSVSGVWLSPLTAALGLGWLGDILLLKRSRTGFAAGVAAFLAGHGVYLVLLLAAVCGGGGSVMPAVLGGPGAVFLGCFLLGLVYYSFLAPQAEGLQPLILVYALMITAMAGAAVTAYLWGDGSVLLPLGALLFVLSDGILGYHALVQRSPRLLPAVMVLYETGQLCLALGLAQGLAEEPHPGNEKRVSLEREEARDAEAAQGDADTVRLLFAGDLMAHDTNYNTKDYDEIYRRIRGSVGWADFAFINLEFPIIDEQAYSTYPRFNVQRDYVEAAIGAGFNRFSLANNHTADFGRAGIAATRESQRFLEKRFPVRFSGLREKAGAEMAAEFWSWRDIRFGFLAVTGFSNRREGTDEMNLTSLRREEDRRALIKRVEAAAGKCDLLVLSFHVGVEYARKPKPEKQEFFEELMEGGVDILWSHHPHVLQPWEVSPRGTVIYSAGNFVSGQTYGMPARVNHRDSRTYKGDSALFCLELRRNELKERGWRVVTASAVPIAHYSIPGLGMVVGRIGDLVRESPGDWPEYYKKRGEIIRRKLLRINSPAVHPRVQPGAVRCPGLTAD